MSPVQPSIFREIQNMNPTQKTREQDLSLPPEASNIAAELEAPIADFQLLRSELLLEPIEPVTLSKVAELLSNDANQTQERIIFESKIKSALGSVIADILP